MLTHGGTSLVYDSEGNRVSETAGGVTTRYLVDTLNPTGYSQVMDEIVNGSVTRTYTYGRQLISENQLVGSTWTPSFYGYDGHGNVRFLTNASGTVGNTYQFDAFGAQIASTGTTPNNYLYSGEWLDPNLSFYNLRARYYNALTGRFETMDPDEGDIADPGTLHKYLYTWDDPVNAIDPRGRDAFIESLFTTTDIRTPLEVNAEIAARSVADIVCIAAKFLGALTQPLPPGAPGPLGFPLWPIKGLAAICTARGL